ncbi:arsenate reductase family protein [Thalassovita taeanensis]|uniref:Arsenate reductase n=1 Tax=Thalassovita taeanensis TaxID=657014 RepID=A0A1H9HFR1_9RHOB|nr:ArsC/Spx/MgsR family protein [Thalassovita taeanensis]SEQ61102.1 arsenate reductase [Thalassovita taeanensis]
MNIYGLKNCDTCRKALKLLEGAVLIDIRSTPMPDDLRARAMAEFGDDLLNTRSTTWRGLDAAARARPMAELLAEYPALMKRPLIEDAKGRLYLGWSKDMQGRLGSTGPTA